MPAPEGRIRGGRGIALRHEGSLVAEGRMAVCGRQHGEQSGFTMSVGVVSFEHESNCNLTNPVSRAIHDEPEVRGVPAPKGRVCLVAEERLGSWWQHGERNGFSNQSELVSFEYKSSCESRVAFQIFLPPFCNWKSNNDSTCPS